MMKPEPLLEAASCCLPGSSPNPPDSAINRFDPGPFTSRSHMCSLLGGWFTMGSADGPYPQDGEGPPRPVYVDPFSVSATAVSNRQFAEFVQNTGYQTEAEKLGWSFVFHLNLSAELPNTQRARHAPWWVRVDLAHWSSPAGGDTSIGDRLEHPVVHITLHDALAFCQWADCRLPTEAEWEFAARGGVKEQPYPWGDELEPEGHQMANTWRGTFPGQSHRRTRTVGTVPVSHYQPNKFGLHNMIGNVWEWTADRFTHLHSPRPARNPSGPMNGGRYVAKGGSYLCHASYCARYRTSSRQALEPATIADNVGFRVVQN